MPNGSDAQHDVAIQQQFAIQRVSAGSVRAVQEHLTALESKLAGIVAGEKDLSASRLTRVKKVMAAAGQAIGSTYRQIATDQRELNLGVAKASTKGAAQLLNETVGAPVFDSLLSPKQLEALVDDDVVRGFSSNAWWKAQDDALFRKFQGEIQTGMQLGESVPQMVRRIHGTKAAGYKDGVMEVSRRDANSLVRTSVQTINNEARLRSFRENPDVIKGVQWVATLDGRTTAICRALDGLTWELDGTPIDHSTPFPGPTAHWNCRSTQIGTMKSWDELAGKKLPSLNGKTLDAAFEKAMADQGFTPEQIGLAKRNTRASMDGQVAKTQSFEPWLRTKSEGFQMQLLGPTRHGLWSAGRIGLRDMVDQTGRELTIKQLMQAVDQGILPLETEGLVAASITMKLFTAEELAAAGRQIDFDAEQDAFEEITVIEGKGGKMGEYIDWAKHQADATSSRETLELARRARASDIRFSKLAKVQQRLSQGGRPTPAERMLINELPPVERAAWWEAAGGEK